MNKAYYKLILITKKININREAYLNFIKSCVERGVTSVQLREKELKFEDIFKFACALHELLKFYEIPLIVNDNLKLAHALDAEGLHVGQSDCHVLEARKKLGYKKIIGLSINSIKELKEANKYPIDYIGLSSIFPTKSKKNIQNFWGCNGILQASKISKHKVVAVGGIDISNASEIMASGASGIACISAFHDSIDPSIKTRNLKDIVEGKSYDYRN